METYNNVLTMAEVAGELGISRAATYDLAKNDPTFRTFKVGGARRMRREALDTWISDQEAKGWTTSNGKSKTA